MFRLATTIATLLLFFTFGLNFVGSQMASQPIVYGMGGGGGGDAESYAAEAPMEEPAMVAPAAPAEEPAAAAEPEVAMDSIAEEQPPVAMAPMTTEVPSTDETSRVMETPASKNGEDGNAVGGGVEQPLQQEAPSPTPLITSAWQIGLAVIAVLGALLMLVMRQLSASRWK
jgi:hypothetical protein